MKKVDLKRYMGDWRVIANIPTFFERNAFNAVEGYRLNEDGSIFNFYECNRGAFDGPLKRITAKGWVVDKRTNAEWKIQFIWPIKVAYQILEYGEDYDYTVVGHPSKKWVWIMSREPVMNEVLFESIIDRLAFRGYDISKILRVPQSAQNRIIQVPLQSHEQREYPMPVPPVRLTRGKAKSENEQMR